MRPLLAGLLLLSAAARQSEPLARIPSQRIYPGLTADQEGRWTAPFSFIQLADPQFGFMDAAQERKNAESAVEHINRLKPRFVIVCGDLVNAVTGFSLEEGGQVRPGDVIARRRPARGAPQGAG